MRRVTISTSISRHIPNAPRSEFIAAPSYCCKIGATSVTARIVFVPGLVIVARRFTERAQNAFQIVVVLKANMLLHNGDAELTGCPSDQMRLLFAVVFEVERPTNNITAG